MSSRTPPPLPLLRRHDKLLTPVQDPTGYIGVLRFNHLTPPFNNPAIRCAMLGAVSQDDYMNAAAGDDPAAWRDGVGFFCPGTPMATDAGLSVLTGPRDLYRARRDIVATGYQGERSSCRCPPISPP